VSNVKTQVNIPLDWKVAKPELTKIIQAHATAINTKPVVDTGSATASFTATNKPGANNKTSPDAWWEIVDSEGTTYYVPVFLP
jgi:hypothetical protein